MTTTNDKGYAIFESEEMIIYSNGNIFWKITDNCINIDKDLNKKKISRINTNEYLLKKGE